ncbi:glutathione S-transferase family protein [Rhodoferax sp.]|uniref:glutathione S-transferase family protein n=1 Tax=Rhodoferax sp. TaxID=50421 RepID=UPI002ACEC3E6|nr:glutathione S-transferase family protein [Rhodoferax sp.]MDZ7920681.1 glutathione S-transferase family protein [Rhodoferax sp.]
MPDTSLTLISHPLCPFVQRAAIVLLEKGVSFSRIDIDLAAKPDWFLALSLTGKVPLLKVSQADGPDAVLFESMVICEYLEESQAGARLYSADALSRARQRGWIEFGTATLAEAWQFLNAKDRPTADAKQSAFRYRLQQLETVLVERPYFGGAAFGMVDVVFAPLFRYFDILDPTVSQPIFENLPRASAWRAALAARQSVIAAVGEDYDERFQLHLRQHQAIHAA